MLPVDCKDEDGTTREINVYNPCTALQSAGTDRIIALVMHYGGRPIESANGNNAFVGAGDSDRSGGHAYPGSRVLSTIVNWIACQHNRQVSQAYGHDKNDSLCRAF